MRMAAAVEVPSAKRYRVLRIIAMAVNARRYDGVMHNSTRSSLAYAFPHRHVLTARREVLINVHHNLQQQPQQQPKQPH